MSLKFIEPMYARAVEKLPEGRDWLYEIKLDGYRCLAGRDAKGVILWSRTANIFTTQFPRVTRGFEKLHSSARFIFLLNELSINFRSSGK
jgi:bifunctional non-homologous end joining protein LigD